MRIAMQTQPEYAKAKKTHQERLEERQWRSNVHGEPAQQLEMPMGPAGVSQSWTGKKPIAKGIYHCLGICTPAPQ